MFQPIEIKWGGKNYSVPANKVLGLIASIESHVNIVALSNPEKMSYVALARGYASAVRYAGGSVTDEEVYAGLFGSGGDNAINVREVIGSLMVMMVPPSQLSIQADEAKKKTTRRSKD